MRLTFVAGLAALGLFLAAGPASAQPPPGRYGRPTYGQVIPPNYGPGYRGNISPYLGIVRGNNTGINYFLGTVSEQQRRQNTRDFRLDIADLDVATRENRQLITTGTNPLRNSMQLLFNNTGGYFPPAGPSFRR